MQGGGKPTLVGLSATASDEDLTPRSKLVRLLLLHPSLTLTITGSSLVVWCRDLYTKPSIDSKSLFGHLLKLLAVDLANQIG